MTPVRKPLPNESHRKHEGVCICDYCRFIMLVKVIAVDAVSPTRTIHVALSPPDTSPIPSYPMPSARQQPCPMLTGWFRNCKKNSEPSNRTFRCRHVGLLPHSSVRRRSRPTTV